MKNKAKDAVENSDVSTQSHSQSFYRLYRPETFEDVIGQDHVVDVLKAAIGQKKVAHAYLFAGSRGTGKTSIARIFARALDTAPEDIYEIDAASHTQVDHMRELNESVSTLPFRSQYKVYILDEAHMLSKAAFNAFLKTLEEPPAHVIFILATTETEKIPETVVSRCQTFRFRTPGVEVLQKVVEKVAKAESLELEKGVSELIALSGDGSFRDTHGALQKVATLSKDHKITLAEAEKVIGAPAHELVKEFLQHFIMKDVKGGLEVISKLKEQGVSMVLFGRLILRLARMLVYRSYSGLVPHNASERESVWAEEMVGKHKAEINSSMLVPLIDAARESTYAFISELPFEMALIKRVEEKTF